jgi:hypothetical protein
MASCPKSLHTTIRGVRQLAYDHSTRSGAAGRKGRAAVLFAKEAETSARNGHCAQARKLLKLAHGSIRRAQRAR